MSTFFKNLVNFHLLFSTYFGCYTIFCVLSFPLNFFYICQLNNVPFHLQQILAHIYDDVNALPDSYVFFVMVFFIFTLFVELLNTILVVVFTNAYSFVFLFSVFYRCHSKSHIDAQTYYTTFVQVRYSLFNYKFCILLVVILLCPSITDHYDLENVFTCAYNQTIYVSFTR